MALQSLLARTLTLHRWEFEGLLVKIAVGGGHEHVRNLNRHGCWVDTDQPKIEKRVDVGPEHSV